MRPAPRIMWPTSEFPIWPSGKPTSTPDIERLDTGNSRVNLSIFGFEACAMALPSFLGLIPHPSKITRITGCFLFKSFSLLLRFLREALAPSGHQSGTYCVLTIADDLPLETDRPGLSTVRAAQLGARAPRALRDRRTRAPVRRRCER